MKPSSSNATHSLPCTSTYSCQTTHNRADQLMLHSRLQISPGPASYPVLSKSRAASIYSPLFPRCLACTFSSPLRCLTFLPHPRSQLSAQEQTRRQCEQTLSAPPFPPCWARALLSAVDMSGPSSSQTLSLFPTLFSFTSGKQSPLSPTFPILPSSGKFPSTVQLYWNFSHLKTIKTFLTSYPPSHCPYLYSPLE